MLDTYLLAPKTLKRLRSGPSGAFIDDFADALERDGYSAASAVRYLRAADHLGRFMQTHGGTLADADPQTSEIFYRHLLTCTCPEAKGGKANHHLYFGAKQVSPHVLRHTCAMIVLRGTQDIRKVSLWLGHSDLATTEIYTRADPTEKLEASTRSSHRICAEVRFGRPIR